MWVKHQEYLVVHMFLNLLRQLEWGKVEEIEDTTNDPNTKN